LALPAQPRGGRAGALDRREGGGGRLAGAGTGLRARHGQLGERGEGGFLALAMAWRSWSCLHPVPGVMELSPSCAGGPGVVSNLSWGSWGSSCSMFGVLALSVPSARGPVVVPNLRWGSWSCPHPVLEVLELSPFSAGGHGVVPNLSWGS